MTLFNLFTTSIFSNNPVFIKLLGLYPYVKQPTKLSKNIIITSITGLFMIIFNIIIYFIYKYLLLPLEIEFLLTGILVILFIMILKITKLLAKKIYDEEKVELYFSSVVINNIILGTSLISIKEGYNLSETIIFSLGSMIGLGLANYLFAMIKYRFDQIKVPRSFKGLPIIFITLAVISLLVTRYFFV